MKEINIEIEKAQHIFLERIRQLNQTGGIRREQYIRFLSMQYHLTKGVQRHFMSIAANPITARKKDLRKWLIKFAQEEEFHFEIAHADLKELGTEPLSIPFDTQLWWNYFDSILEKSPFIRLGATCILENIAGTSSDELDKLIQKSDFLNPKNLRFLIIHRHGPNLDHGSEVLNALHTADLNSEEVSQVIEGARKAIVFYSRFMHWIIKGEELSESFK